MSDETKDQDEQPGEPEALSETADRVMLEKLEALRAAGLDPYAEVRFDRTHNAAEIIEGYDALEGQNVRVAGRILTKRVMGKAGFADLHDQSGKIQLYFKRDDVKYARGEGAPRPDGIEDCAAGRGLSAYELYKKLDLGDIIGAEGFVFKTKTGEISIHVESFTLLCKILRPLPEKWHGLTDVEARYRHRYVDLAINREVRDRFLTLCKAKSEIRRFLESRDFVEVETPLLHEIAGGATAEPFVTHYNALDQDMYMRIAIELHLKRLIVGGMERVFEMGRVFRNEGTSVKHNPEFTMLELYWAYADYGDVMELTESLVAHVAKNVFGSYLRSFGGIELDFTPPFKRMKFADAMRTCAGVELAQVRTLDAVVAKAKSIGLELPEKRTYEKVLDEIFKELVEPNLIQPTFILDYPVELTLLAKRRPDDPRLVYRFELFVAGFEIANSFSEANDPLDQRARMEEQVEEARAAGEEFRAVDEDFLAALEYGMPPNGGLGIGIDRLCMLLSGQQSIREVLLFPQLRKK
ncbi:MAG: lysine--tRNA ligase [bacterium]|jgi:lysyl-tRNA synthetase class 2